MTKSNKSDSHSGVNHGWHYSRQIPFYRPGYNGSDIYFCHISVDGMDMTFRMGLGTSTAGIRTNYCWILSNFGHIPDSRHPKHQCLHRSHLVYRLFKLGACHHYAVSGANRSNRTSEPVRKYPCHVFDCRNSLVSAAQAQNARLLTH